jgi:outer membrane protein TolC
MEKQIEAAKIRVPYPAIYLRRKSLEPSEAQIRERAYRLYLERGQHSGRELLDWLDAERELRNIFAN